MAALGKPAQALHIHVACLLADDVGGVAGLVLAQLLELVEGVRQGSGRDDDDLAVAGGDGLADGATHAQKVIGLTGLADAHREPALVHPPTEIAPQVERGVVQREIFIVDGGDPRAIGLTAGGDGLRELRVTAPLKGNAAHPARQLLGGEEACATGVGGDDKLDRGEPVRVQHDHGVVVEGLELLLAQPLESGDDRDLFAVVELVADVLGKHDRGDMRQQARGDNLTHDYLQPIGE